MRHGFFEDQNGDKSSSRLIAVIMIGFGLIMSSSFILIGLLRPEVDLMKTALAIGVLFSSVAGPALLFLFAQKKEEGKQEEVKQNLTAKVENPDNKNLTDIKTT